MRAAFIGAGELAQTTARALIDRGHDVLIVERDKETIDALKDDLDCGFLHGDGSKPAVLRELDPRRTDILFCLTDETQLNVIASLVGRSLGFGRIITSVHDSQFEAICDELGLEDVIVPTRTISRYLVDMASGRDVAELHTAIKGEARFLLFKVASEHVGPVSDLELPPDARVVCCYRAEELVFTDDSTHLRKGDEVVILTHSRNLEMLRERFIPQAASAGDR